MKKMSFMASLAIIPAVLGGLLLLGFQTYMLFTGKSFSDLNFDIGKLWQTPEKIDVPLRSVNSDVFINPLFKEKESNFSLFDQLREKTVSLPSPKKQASIPASQEAKKVEEKVKKEFFEVEALDQVKIYSVTRGKQFAKYVTRLDKEYLINPNITPKQGKWYIGASFSPTLNYRTFSYDHTLVKGVAVDGNRRYTFGLTENQRDVSDKSITSYSFGFDIGRQLTPKITFYSGLHYARYGEQILVKAVNHSNPNYELSSFHGEKPKYEVFDEENALLNLPFRNKYSFIELPVGVSIEIAQFNKSIIRAELGVAFQRLTAVNALIYDFDTDYYYWMNEEASMFRAYGIGSQLGLSISQFVGERTEVFANPQFKFNLNSTFERPYPVSQNQYTTGLRLGVKQHIL